MPPAARLTDLHVCPMVTVLVPHVGGPITGPGAPTVLTGKMPQARITDMLVCVGPPDVIAMGCPTVLAMSMPAARMGDMTAHGGAIVLGFPTVLIGDGGGGAGALASAAAAAAGLALAGIAGALAGTATAPALTGSTDIGELIELNDGAAYQSPEAQALTNQQAAQNGTPFIDRC